MRHPSFPHWAQVASYRERSQLMDLSINQSLSLTYSGAIGRDLLRVTDLFNVKSEFSGCLPDRQYGDFGLSRSPTQVPAEFVAGVGGIGIVYVLALD